MDDITKLVSEKNYDEISLESSGEDENSIQETLSDDDYGNNNITSHQNSKEYDEREEYINFIRSVFNDDDLNSVYDEHDNAYANDDDDDEEEDYKPVDNDFRDDALDDEDDEGDDELVKVAKHEVHELVDVCLQTLVSSTTNKNILPPPPQLQPTLSGTQSSLPTTQPSRIPDTFPSSTETETFPADDYETSAKCRPHTSNMSDVVKRLLSSGNTSDICVDGMSVDTVRKLVARQMSMALQLLVQIMLKCDPSSNTYKQAHSNLMEMSNYRENAIKKAALMQETVKTLTSCRRAVDRPSNSENNNINIPIPSSTATAILCTSGSSIGSTKPLTRSQINNQVERTTSVFDAPILGNVQRLLGDIDKNHQGAEFECQKNVVQCRFNNSSPSANLVGVLPFPHEQEMSKSTSLRGVFSVRLAEDVKNIFVVSQMRHWNCLIPTSNYPLPAEACALGYQATAAGTLLGRTFFSPAEDDLLLRGVVVYGADWGRIRQALLPSKDEHLLQFRFTQMTTQSADEDNKFKRYVRLEKEKRNRDNKWSFEEDVQLLRGFESFGERWALVSLFFLPHRQRRELRLRWSSLLKDWVKMFAGSSSEPSSQLSGNMVTFLRQMKAEAQRREREQEGGVKCAPEGPAAGDGLGVDSKAMDCTHNPIADTSGGNVGYVEALARSAGIDVCNQGLSIQQKILLLERTHFDPRDQYGLGGEVERDSLSDSDSDSEYPEAEGEKDACPSGAQDIVGLSLIRNNDICAYNNPTRQLETKRSLQEMAFCQSSPVEVEVADRWEVAPALSRGVAATVNQLASSVQRSELLPLESAMLFLRQNGVDDVFEYDGNVTNLPTQEQEPGPEIIAPLATTGIQTFQHPSLCLPPQQHTSHDQVDEQFKSRKRKNDTIDSINMNRAQKSKLITTVHTSSVVDLTDVDPHCDQTHNVHEPVQVPVYDPEDSSALPHPPFQRQPPRTPVQPQRQQTPIRDISEDEHPSNPNGNSSSVALAMPPKVDNTNIEVIGLWDQVQVRSDLVVQESHAYPGEKGESTFGGFLSSFGTFNDEFVSHAAHEQPSMPPSAQDVRQGDGVAEVGHRCSSSPSSQSNSSVLETESSLNFTSFSFLVEAAMTALSPTGPNQNSVSGSGSRKRGRPRADKCSEADASKRVRTRDSAASNQTSAKKSAHSHNLVTASQPNGALFSAVTAPTACTSKLASAVGQEEAVGAAMRGVRQAGGCAAVSGEAVGINVSSSVGSTVGSTTGAEAEPSEVTFSGSLWGGLMSLPAPCAADSMPPARARAPRALPPTSIAEAEANNSRSGSFMAVAMRCAASMRDDQTAIAHVEHSLYEANVALGPDLLLGPSASLGPSAETKDCTEVAVQESLSAQGTARHRSVTPVTRFPIGSSDRKVRDSSSVVGSQCVARVPALLMSPPRTRPSKASAATPPNAVDRGKSPIKGGLFASVISGAHLKGR